MENRGKEISKNYFDYCKHCGANGPIQCKQCLGFSHRGSNHVWCETTKDPNQHDDVQSVPVLAIVLLAVTSIQARISVMYAHDKISDIIAEQCLNEMYPKVKHVEIQESDEPCIIFCVLKKFGIMNSNGVINLEAYRKRVLIARKNEQRTQVSDYGGTCIESAEATQHKQDVCKKAKVFNDCTHLYRILLK